jgi:hypothetical protein
MKQRGILVRDRSSDPGCDGSVQHQRFQRAAIHKSVGDRSL